MNRSKFFIFKAFISISLVFSCDSKTGDNKNLIDHLLRNDKESFGIILDNLKKHEVQIIYTQINRDSANNPSFKSFYFNVDPERYFYPASTVKMPVAFLALEKLQNLNIKGLDRNTTFLTDSAYHSQSAAMNDSTSENGLPNIAHYIKKIFIVSDNDAYNRLYEFIGQEEINRKLRTKGYTSTRLIHRLSIPLSPEENQHTNPVRFLNGDSVIYEQPLVKSALNYQPDEKILKGKAYVDNDGQLIKAPFDFTYKNFMPLEEMQMMLRSVIFPETTKGVTLSSDNRDFVLKYMSQLPRETLYPAYDEEEYYDAYSKFLLFGKSRRIPNNIRMFNKIGQAYGYLIDNAYIIDFDHNVEFLLSAVIHVNNNETYNDGEYEYDKIGYPFMQRLGEVIHEYELNRPRAVQPDLSPFKINYDK
ncbi:MAG: serine hydrolase [Bacteroidota bacterium]